MDAYPEHEKLREVRDVSQAIGEFLDFGLPRMGMAIYQKITRPCECSWCERGVAHRSAWHSDEEKETMVDGVVQVTDWQPTHRTIQAILADYFGIDQDKVDAEKEAMFEALRSAA